MVFVNHYFIIQINSCRFIGNVHLVVCRQVPYGESFKFGITGFDSPFVFMVKIAQAGGKFSAARARAGNDNNRFGNFNIFIGAISLLTHNGVRVCWVSFCWIMQINPDPSQFELVFKNFCRLLILVSGNNNCRNINAPFPEIINGLQCVRIVSYAKISPDFFPFNVSGMNTKDNICFVFYLVQEAHFYIGVKSREHPGGVVIVQYFSAKLQI